MCTIGHDLARRGLSVQQPIKRAHEQRPEAIAQWLHPESPRITRHAAEGAEIDRRDATSLSTSDPRGRGFAPIGRTPAVARWRSCRRVSRRFRPPACCRV
ncbi:winged helix-turn-helix domain-containing protein [Gemmatimonas sp.]|uniref:winged helix-turn-helix domain-containing protein n=1 Tax=Gemmatimonas sp. TaxID=1962908 RepID=UPI0037BF2BD4